MSTLDASLAPGYLVAAPNLDDPNFAKTVVLMAEHSDGGSIGFVVNRTLELNLGTLLENIDPELARAAERAGLSEQPVFVGGPVQRHIAWVLYPRQGDLSDEMTLPIGEEFVLGASMEILRSLVFQERDGPFQIFLGYSGWATLQLEHEISEGSWLPMPFHHDFIFDIPTEMRWEEAQLRLGLIPGGFMMGGPGASA